MLPGREGEGSNNRARFKFSFRVHRTVCDRPPESSRFGAHAELILSPTEMVRLGVWLLAGGAPGMGRERLEPGRCVNGAGNACPVRPCERGSPHTVEWYTAGRGFYRPLASIDPMRT